MFRRFRSRASKFPIVQFELSRLSFKFLSRRRIQPLPLNQITSGNGQRDVESGELRQPTDQERGVANSQVGSGHGRPPNLEGRMSAVAEHSQVATTGALLDEAEHSAVVGSNLDQARDQEDHLGFGQNEGQIQPEDDQNQAGRNEGEGGEMSNAELEQPNAEQEIQTFAVPTYLQAHFEMMYLLGLSPVNGNGEMGPPEQLVFFVLIFGMGLFDALGGWKICIVRDEKPGELIQYITIGYLLGIVLLQLYGAKLVTMGRRYAARILQRKFADDDSLILRKQPKRKIAKESAAYFLIVILMSLAGALRVDWVIEGDTPSQIILSRARLVSEYLYYWEKGSNGTDPRNELFEKYGTYVSPTSVAMGAFGFGSVFVNNLQDHFVRDILLMTALHTHRMTQIYHSTVLKILQDAGNNDDIIPNLREIHDKFAMMSNEIEFGFGNFFKVIHLQNWLFCSYFLLDVFVGDTNDVYFIFKGYIIPKILLAYYIASKAFRLTQAAKNAIEKYYDRNVSDPVEKLKAKLFLKTVKRSPLGNGRGQFQLDESFVSSFVCVVISCFLLFADAQNKK